LKGRITAIRNVGGDPPRVAVQVDGREAFTVSAEVAERLSLNVGADIGSEETESLRDDDERGRAREAALRLLAVRARSEHELTTRLRQKGFRAGTTREVVSALAGVGLIDDEAFARAWAEERLRLRPVGPRRLSQELAAKGVARELADMVIAEAFAEQPELEVARRAASRRAGSLRGGDPRKVRARLHSFLVRRGFSYEVAATVIRELEGERDV
jgi:regulatory protein